MKMTGRSLILMLLIGSAFVLGSAVCSLVAEQPAEAKASARSKSRPITRSQRASSRKGHSGKARRMAGKRGGKHAQTQARQPEAPPAPNLVSEAKQRLADGKVEEAVALLEKTLAGYPKDVTAHLMLGETLCTRKEFSSARPHLISVMRLSRGSCNACKANLLLFSMPPEVIAPRVGPETVAISRSLGGWFAERGIQTGKGLKPTVIDFWASWSQPCKSLRPAMEKAKSELSDKIEFLSINVDDPENEYMIEKYGVSPVPTVVFLNKEGQVVSYSINGEDETLSEGLRSVLAR